MATIIVDSDKQAAEKLAEECRQVSGIYLTGCFTEPEEALEYARHHVVNFALLEVELHHMSGIELAQKLRELKPDIIIIFVSADSEAALDAFKIKADYFVLKPYRKEDITDALERAKLLVKRQKKKIFIRTFGRFDVFVDEELVRFPNAKSKELLALCVDHICGEVSMEEAIDKLWPDRDYDSRVKALYRKAVIGIRSVLEECGRSEIFCSRRGACFIKADAVLECDYYEYLKNSSNGIHAYAGEYMFEYSWGEETNAWLQTLSE